MEDEIRQFDIPKILYFQKFHLNTYTGSWDDGFFNYIIKPELTDYPEGVEPEDGENPPTKLTVKVWYGLKCSDLSETVAETEFVVLSRKQEGLDAIENVRSWLFEQYGVYCENRTEIRQNAVSQRPAAEHTERK